MEQNVDIFKSFETALKTRNLRKPLPIYTEKIEDIKVTSYSERLYSAKDVLSNISKQLNALQSADVFRRDLNPKNKILEFKKSNFVPVNLFSFDNNLPQQSDQDTNKFETQCVSDTQLLNIVENAEKMVGPKGVTQEFENMFCEQHVQYEKEDKRSADYCYNKCKHHEDNIVVKDLDIYNSQLMNKVPQFFTNAVLDENSPSTSKEHCNNESNIYLLNIFDNKESTDIKYYNENEVQENMTLSPIINYIKPLSLNSNPCPLIYALDDFENFEALAFPVVGKSTDLEAAKQLIHSQIIEKELYLGTHTEPTLKKVVRCTSPVLSIKRDRYLTNSPSTSLTAVNNEVNKEPLKDPDKGLAEKGLSTLTETEVRKCFEDEILFSSDEENSEENEFQELPFTCALETSFYNQSDILDKTMYVGFQTASNKSIQIDTDSFSMAKSILGDLGINSYKPNFTELVAMCDFNSTNNMGQLTMSNGENKNVQLSTTDNLSKGGAFESKADSKTIQPISDTSAITKEPNLSIKLQYGSKPYHKEIEYLNNVTSNKIMFNNVNNQLPNLKHNNSGIERELRENSAAGKHELLQFRTASNKKIKLSDTALARCRQVFQDIDLDDKYDGINLEITQCSTQVKIPPNIPIEAKYNEVGSLGLGDFKENEIIKVSQQIELDDHNLIQEFENDLMSHDSDEKAQVTDNVINREMKRVNNKNEQKFRRVLSKWARDTEHDQNNFTSLSNEKLPSNSDNFTIHQVINVKPVVRNHIDDRPAKETFVGFKTASNKKIIISEQAFATTKNMFDDFDLHKNIDKHNEIDISYNDNIVNNDVIGSFNTSKIKESIISGGAARRSSPKFEDFVKDESLVHDVGENNQLNISKEKDHSKYEITKLHDSLPLSHKNDCLIDNFGINPKSDDMKALASCGFKTASKKPVIVSSEALFKSKKLFEEIDNSMCGSSNLSKKVGEAKFKGFKTASNNPVSVSGEALAKTRSIFQDININFEAGQHVSHKPVEIHSLQKDGNKLGLFEEALARNKRIIEVDYCDENDISRKTENFGNSPDIGFKGFFTASNKEVKISKEALAKSKKILQDLDTDKNEVSESMLDKTRVITCSRKRTYDLTNAETGGNGLEFNIKNNDYNQYDLFVEKDRLQNLPQLIFRGFQTANNKQVEISDNALARSKKLFEDLCLNENAEQNDVNINTFNDTQIKTCSERTLGVPNDYCNSLQGFEFKTANNKDIKISEEAKLKSKKILNFNQNGVTKTADTITDETTVNCRDNINLETVIDTQVLNDFEETLYTEDFYNEIKPNKSKRSGSPILLCPRAKKCKRFEVPYRSEQITKEEKGVPLIFEENMHIPFAFDKTYKKNKRFSLKDLRNMEKLRGCQYEIDPYLLYFNFDNVLDFEFTNTRNDLTNVRWSTEDLKKYFLSLVNTKIIPDGWLDNHLKLIIFKCISYEIRFKNTMRGICTVKNVLEQLKYRYDRELYNVERPAFRKLLEKDDVSTKTIIVRVIALYGDGVIVTSATRSSNIELLVTDGWYCIRACLDQMLMQLARDHKICVGTKLATHGAELLNCEQGIAPWEDTSSVRLKLFGNSTRRARWDARLGYHGAGAILTSLSSVQLEGGKVSKLRALVTRVYPTLYVEKFEDGSTVTRSERLELIQQMKYESERQALLEKIYEEVEKEFIDQESQDSECDSGVRGCLDSGSQINRAMKQSKDPMEFRANLTNTQCVLLQNYASRRRDKLLQSVQARVEERLKARGCHVGRNVVPVLKIRIADVGGNGEVSKAMMSVWRPSDAVLDIIKEGAWIDVFNVVPTAIRYSEIQLSAGRQTVFCPSNDKNDKGDERKRHTAQLKRICYSTRDLVQNPTITTEYNEVDAVGLIYLIEPSIEQFESIKGQLFQNVYLTDADKNMICVNFWGGLKKFGYENIIDTGQVVACMNLQKRAGNTRKSIPQYRATEFSYFTKTSKLADVRKMAEELKKALSSVNVDKFCQECITMRNNYSIIKNNAENISPYRINYSDYNVSTHKAFIDSPLARKQNKVDDTLNLSGLDFESTFKQIDTQDMSPSTLLRKKKVNEKIARLKMYGEPPPLKPMHIINKSKNATSAFKSPLSTKDDTSNGVASEKSKDPNCTINHLDSSPVISVKNCSKRNSVNPVKLNFSSGVHSEVSKVIDPFEEEFDVSPPLSLD